MIIDLPFDAANAEDRTVIREAGLPAAPAPRRVLVVEDESDLARVVKRHVETLGCELQVAASGEEALELAREAFDLVLLDVMLPALMGWKSVAACVRSTDTCRS